MEAPQRARQLSAPQTVRLEVHQSHEADPRREDSRPAAGRRGGVGGRQLQQVYGRDNPCALPSSAGTAVLGGIDAMWPSLAPLLLLGCCRAAARARACARALARASARAAPSGGCQRPLFPQTHAAKLWPFGAQNRKNLTRDSQKISVRTAAHTGRLRP